MNGLQESQKSDVVPNVNPPIGTKIRRSRNQGEYYVYVWLDPRKPGKYVYGEYEFEYEPFYVGAGLNSRCYVYHRKSNKEVSARINYMVDNYNQRPLVIKIQKNLSLCGASQLEDYLITIIGKFPEGILLNKQGGGHGHHILPQHIKEKLSQIASQRVYTEVTRNKISKALQNRYFSEEHRHNISIARKGKRAGVPLSTEHKQRLSLATKGRPHSDEHNLHVKEGVQRRLADPSTHLILSTSASKGWDTRRLNKQLGILQPDTLIRKERKLKNGSKLSNNQ